MSDLFPKPIKKEKDSQGVVIRSYKNQIKTNEIPGKIKTFTASANGVYFPVLYATEKAAYFGVKNFEYDFLRDLFNLVKRRKIDLKTLKALKSLKK